MKGQIFNPGSPVKKADLDRSDGGNEEGTRERLSDLFTSGALQGTQFAGENIPFEITPGGGLTIDVGSGLGVGAHTIPLPETVSAQEPTYAGAGDTTGGERILIPAADITQVYSRDPAGGSGTGTGTGPFKETTNGLGGFTATPESTGTKGVDVSALNGSLVRVWLAYLNTTDSSVTSLHKVTNATLYPKQTDGYDIQVNASATPPGGSAKYILQGTVDLTGSPGSVSAGDISQSTQVFARTRLTRVGITIDDTKKPATYANGETKNIDDLVNCKGTGTLGRTPENPFEQSVNDFEDVDTLGASAIQSQRDSHTDGIVAPNNSNSLDITILNGTSIGGSAAVVSFDQLLAGESIYLDGQRFTLVTPSDPAAGTTGGNNNGYIPFFTADEGGVVSETRAYQLFARVIGGLATLDKVKDIESLPSLATKLADVTWASGTLTTLVDIRPFALTGPKDIRDDAVLSKNIDEADGTSAQVTTAGSGVKTGHVQDDAINSQKIDEADGTSGQVTTTGSGIKTGHLQDDSVTTSKIPDDAITPAKLDDAGDFTVATITTTGDATVGGKLTVTGEIDPPKITMTSTPVGTDAIVVRDNADTEDRFSVDETGNVAAKGDLDVEGELKQDGSPVMPTGAVITTIASVEPVGWLFLDADTIGNTGSGATHTGANLETLFNLVKELAPNTGAESFIGGQTVVLPDGRGRAMIGSGSGPGLTSRTTGDPGGAELHLHADGTLATGGPSLGQKINVSTAPTEVAHISHVHDVTGSTADASTMQPFLVLNYIIKI